MEDKGSARTLKKMGNEELIFQKGTQGSHSTA